MVMFADVQDHNDRLVRKALGGLVGVAPTTTAALTTIVDATTGELVALPAGWELLGRPNEDGLAWPRETETSDIYGLGSTDPARSDVRRTTKQLTVNSLESRRKNFELAYGVDLSAIAPNATTGEVTFDEPALPNFGYFRVVAIARDITGAGEMYVGRQFLRAKVTEVGEETWSDGDNAMVIPITFTAFQDPDAGTAVRHFRAGPGYAEVVADEGFPAA